MPPFVISRSAGVKQFCSSIDRDAIRFFRNYHEFHPAFDLSFSSCTLFSRIPKAFFKKSFSAYSLPTSLSSSSLRAASLYILPFPLKADSGSLSYSNFHLEIIFGWMLFSRLSCPNFFPLSSSLIRESLNSRVYLVLDVFPMFSLFETHLNYLSTLRGALHCLSLIHISEPTRLGMISYAV